MKYLINAVVMFDTDAYQLYLINDESTVIKLSATSGRVLEELIVSHGQGNTVTREWLFEQVWVKHGMQPSNGNLNQQVSLLRKALLSLGLETTAIITLPKKGFKINDAIEIAVADSLLEPEQSLQSEDAETALKQQIESPPPPASINFKRILNALLLLSAALTVFVTYIFFSDNDKQEMFFLANIGHCDVYNLRSFNEQEREQLITQVSLAMEGNIEKCHARQVVIFSRNRVSNTSVKSSINQWTFMAKCEKNASGNLAGCLNFYFYNWGV